jgi:UDP-N-acetylmuramoyl-L-alanyl-D-glutamate--2,6-diaminopimelate ligase
MKNLAQLLQALNGFTVKGQTEKPVSSIEYDSRSCQEFSLFVAIPGSTNPPLDGNQFIQDAIVRGAKTIVTDSPDCIVPDDVTIIGVPDARIALSRISNAFYDYPARQLRIYGVTGTNGKTSTTFLMKAIFDAMGEPTGLIGTTGNYIGDERIAATHTTPESPHLCQLLSMMVRRGIKTVVMEVSSHALALHRVEGIRFAGAIFTNLTHDHLDFHGSMERYAQAKKHLFDMLPKEAIAIVMGDSPYSYLMLSDCIAEEKYRVGRSTAFDISIDLENHSLSGTSYRLSFGGFIPEFHQTSLDIVSPLIGRFNVENTALAASLAHLIGIDAETIQHALRSAEGAPGRMQKLRLPNGALVLVDYAHTPDALEKSLMTCRSLINTTGKGRLTVVFGCGGDRDSAKRPIMGRIASELADRIIITDDNPRFESSQQIINDIINGIEDADMDSVIGISDRKQAISHAMKMSEDREIILIAGKGHEEYQIIGNDIMPFSDLKTVQTLISTIFFS